VNFALANFELAKVERWNLGLSAGAVAASFALVTPHFATSLAAGAFIEAINLGAIHRAAKRLFAGELMSNGWIGGLAFRFVLLGAAIFVTMRAGAHPVALLIGLSIAMPATLIDAWINRPPIIDPATLPVFLDDGIDEEEDDRIFTMGRLFTSKYSERPDDSVIQSADAVIPPAAAVAQVDSQAETARDQERTS
jgi:hypothetical protein